MCVCVSVCVCVSSCYQGSQPSSDSIFMTFTSVLCCLALPRSASRTPPLSISSSLISIAIQMLTFKATSHADWLADWLADKAGGAGGQGTGGDRETETCRSQRKLGKSSSPRLYLPPPPPSRLPVCEWVHKPPEGVGFHSFSGKLNRPLLFVCVCVCSPIYLFPTPTLLFTVSLSLCPWGIKFGSVGVYLTIRN